MADNIVQLQDVRPRILVALWSDRRLSTGGPPGVPAEQGYSDPDATEADSVRCGKAFTVGQANQELQSRPDKLHETDCG